MHETPRLPTPSLPPARAHAVHLRPVRLRSHDAAHLLAVSAAKWARPTHGRLRSGYARACGVGGGRGARLQAPQSEAEQAMECGEEWPAQQQLSRRSARDVTGVAGPASRHPGPKAPAMGTSHALGAQVESPESACGRRSGRLRGPSTGFSREARAAAGRFASHTAVSEAEEDAVDEAVCAAPMLAPATSTATSTSMLGRRAPLATRIELARGVARVR